MQLKMRPIGWIAALSISYLFAQNTPAQQPSESAPPAAVAPADANPPPPGEDIMHPTEHGVRLTPAMARAFARMRTTAMRDEYKLTKDQEQQLSEAYARRFMQTARKYEEQGQGFAEAAIESIWTGIGNGKNMWDTTADMGRELGNRALPAIPGIRELMDGMVTDSEPILSPEAMEKFRKDSTEARKELDKFDEKMKRWSQGEMKPGEDPFNDRSETATQSGNNQSGADGGAPRKPASPEVERAERSAEATLAFAGVNEWTMFKTQVEKYFKFDEQQKAKADQTLATYRAKADAIMTPQWKESMRQNRIKVNLRSQLKGVPTAPWFWRLEYQYSQALRPVQELGWAFKKEILGLVTRAQREAALTDLGTRAGQQGLTLEDKDQAALGLSSSNWNFWKF